LAVVMDFIPPFFMELPAADAARGLDGVDTVFARPDPDGFLDVG